MATGVQQNFCTHLTASLRTPSAPQIPQLDRLINKTALDHLREMASSRPIECRDLVRAGLISMKDKKYNSAVFLFSLPIAENNGDLFALFYRAEAYFKGGNIPFALEDLRQIFEEAGRKSDKDIITLRNRASILLAEIHLQNKNNVAALQLLDQIIAQAEIKKPPFNEYEIRAIELSAEIRFLQAEAKYHAHKFTEAIEGFTKIFSDAARRLPSPFTDWEIKATAFLGQLQLQIAEKFIHDQNTRDALFHLDQIVFRAQKRNTQLSDTEMQAVELAINIHLREGELKYKAGQFEQALIDLRAVIKYAESRQHTPFADLGVKANDFVQQIEFELAQKCIIGENPKGGLTHLFRILAPVGSRKHAMSEVEFKAADLSAKIRYLQAEAKYREGYEQHALGDLKEILLDAERRLPNPFSPWEIKAAEFAALIQVQKATAFTIHKNKDFALGNLNKIISRVVNRNYQNVTPSELRAMNLAVKIYLQMNDIKSATENNSILRNASGGETREYSFNQTEIRKVEVALRQSDRLELSSDTPHKKPRN